MYTKIQTGSITLALERTAPYAASFHDKGNIPHYSLIELSSQDESSLEMESRTSEGEAQEGSAEYSEDEETGGSDNIRIQTPIFDNPLRYIDLDADIQEFLATKRISDVKMIYFHIIQ